MRQIHHFWIFWLITLLLYHQFKIGQELFWIMVSSCKKCKKVFCRIWKRWFISWITGHNVQKLQILLFFTSYIAGILKNIHCNCKSRAIFGPGPHSACSGPRLRLGPCLSSMGKSFRSQNLSMPKRVVQTHKVVRPRLSTVFAVNHLQQHLRKGVGWVYWLKAQIREWPKSFACFCLKHGSVESLPLSRHDGWMGNGQE